MPRVAENPITSPISFNLCNGKEHPRLLDTWRIQLMGWRGHQKQCHTSQMKRVSGIAGATTSSYCCWTFLPGRKRGHHDAYGIALISTDLRVAQRWQLAIWAEWALCLNREGPRYINHRPATTSLQTSCISFLIPGRQVHQLDTRPQRT